MKKTTLMTLALACSLSLAAFASPAKDKVGSIESNYQIFTNDDLIAQPDYNVTAGSFNLINNQCSPIENNKRYQCSGVMRQTNLQSGQETFTIGSTVSGDMCAIVIKSDNAGNFSYDPIQSKCTGPNNWQLINQSNALNVAVSIGQNY